MSHLVLEYASVIVLYSVEYLLHLNSTFHSVHKIITKHKLSCSKVLRVQVHSISRSIFFYSLHCKTKKATYLSTVPSDKVSTRVLVAGCQQCRVVGFPTSTIKCTTIES